MGRQATITSRMWILIKSIIQAILTYAMGCFKLLLGLCHEIEVLIRKFWWGQWGDKRNIHWFKWDEMTKSKLVGGMGFQDLALYNDSLLEKQARHLLQDRKSLFYQVFKAQFFPHCSIMESSDSRVGSYAWKSILHGRDVIAWGCIGNGRIVKIWQQH